MTVAFLFFVPIGILVARYCRHQPNVSFLHGSLMSLTAELVLAAATAALFTHSVAHEMDVHRAIGITTACVIITTIILASNIYKLAPLRRLKGGVVDGDTHWCTSTPAGVVMALGWVNVGLGLKFLWPEYLPVFYAVVVVVGTTIVGLDVRARALNGDCRLCSRRAKRVPDLLKDAVSARSSPRLSPKLYVASSLSDRA